MTKKANTSPRREESLSRDRIIEASIALLDSSGERGLTFRALAERLATGPGAIYWHIDHKSDLLTAACDAIIARALSAPVVGVTPEASIRALALSMFDAIDAHPWIGSALTRAPGQLPMVRIFERIGQQVRMLGVAESAQWGAVSALLSYILGVSGQNAANAHIAREQGADRVGFLEQVSTMWSELDQNEYPFTRSVAGQLSAHDDRVDFLAGIDLILRGMELADGH
ncbi:TetR/AcrR family transcriptional regulator [Paraburkholderia sp. BCC1884]|uniref:TetR/AcrR family transcriptional regulator n=1 Tax=Paraburkholderia sp. BCC1884 TaxID=2562668 RepID=UPI001183949E|nr:TetR family transcriptional regulator [Paraburkholderia sp. BCC1884]